MFHFRQINYLQRQVHKMQWKNENNFNEFIDSELINSQELLNAIDVCHNYIQNDLNFEKLIMN